MANSEMDIIKSDPTEFATKVSKISLASGSLFGAAVVLGVIKINTDKWTIDPWLLRIAIVGAIVLALASVGARALDLIARAALAAQLIQTKGTSDPKAAGRKVSVVTQDDELFDKLLDKGMLHGLYVAKPGSFPIHTSPPPG